MSDSASATSLDFDRADFSNSGGGHAAPACAKCAGALQGSYYTLGEDMLCEACHYQTQAAGPPGSMFTRAFGALALGVVAAVVAGALWMLVTELTGYELGIVAIAVGLGVGVAVRIGARGVGGVGYQLLAVGLTYSAIVMTYVPVIVAELRNNEEIMAGFETAAGEEEALAEPAAAGDGGRAALDPGAITATLYVLAVPLAFAAPFLMGLGNAIGILIIGFALWEAWKINRRVELKAQGPFRLGVDTAAVG